METSLIHLEIDKDALINNVQQFVSLIDDDVIFTAGVKANAFGHGLLPVSKLFLENGVDWLFVNSLEEAVELREAGVLVPILVAGYVQQSDLEELMILGDIHPIVYNDTTILELSRLALKFGVEFPLHVMIDTGIHRQGVMWDDGMGFVERLMELPGLKLEGLCTHFATADEPEMGDYFYLQLERFKGFYKDFESKGYSVDLRHAACSAAALLYVEDSVFNMIRPAASLYGILPYSGCLNGTDLNLKQSMAFKTKIARLQWVPEGSAISYGCTYRTSRRTRLALLPVGYREGVNRLLANRGEVLVNGKRCLILGKVTMHMLMVDVTDAGDVELEDEVVLFGEQCGEVLDVHEWSNWLGTNVHEVMLNIPDRILRVYL